MRAHAYRSGSRQAHTGTLAPMSPAPTRVLVVTDRIAAAPELIREVRAHAGNGPVAVRLLVPNPAPAEWHPTHPHRHVKAMEAEHVLQGTLPALREAAGT